MHQRAVDFKAIWNLNPLLKTHFQCNHRPSMYHIFIIVSFGLHLLELPSVHQRGHYSISTSFCISEIKYKYLIDCINPKKDYGHIVIQTQSSLGSSVTIQAMNESCIKYESGGRHRTPSLCKHLL